MEANTYIRETFQGDFFFGDFYTIEIEASKFYKGDFLEFFFFLVILILYK